ncbi:MAG: ATP-binding cassette domain-containing protein, partial [Eggerthellaceae bacterium]
WDVAEGAVRIGDVDVRDIPSARLMERVAFVFQNERLFKQSLADNIRAARPDATRAQVEAAAHAAQCDDIVAKLPDGLDTVVGAKGIYLSGGECQRVALARATRRRPSWWTEDAACRPENEYSSSALAELTRSKTVLMIAIGCPRW